MNRDRRWWCTSSRALKPVVRLVLRERVGEGPAAGHACRSAVLRPSARLVWRKHRWYCPHSQCPAGSWTREDVRVAFARQAITDRAGRWVCEQIGRLGRTVAEVSRELGCDWHTVKHAMIACGTPLVDDPNRIGAIRARQIQRP